MLLVAKMIIFLPFVSGVFNGIFCKKINNRQASVVASVSIIISAICAAYLFMVTGVNKQPVHVVITKWICAPIKQKIEC